MSKRRKVLVILGLIAVVAVCITALWPRDEPKYQGRYLTDWLGVYEAHVDQQSSPEYFEAEAAVRSIGTNALPYYLNWIGYEKPRWRVVLRGRLPGWVSDSPIGDRMLEGAAGRRASYAYSGIGILSTNAVSALPVLESVMKDPRKPRASWRAMLALASLGTASVPVLQSALANTNQINRSAIPYALRIAAFYAGTNACRPILIHALDDGEAYVRRSATNVLNVIAPEVLTNAPAQ